MEESSCQKVHAKITLTTFFFKKIKPIYQIQGRVHILMQTLGFLYMQPVSLAQFRGQP